MKANDIYLQALALMPAFVSNDELKDRFISSLNILISEIFDIENGLRRAINKEELTIPPSLSSLTDTLDLDWRLMRIVLVYGTAGMLYGEEDGTLATSFLNKYEYEKSRLIKFEHVDVVDVYGGGR